VQAGAYEVGQGLFTPYYNSGWRFDTSLDSGVEVPVEVGYLPKLGAAQLPGHYKLGFGYDSSNYKDLYLDAAGVPILQSGQPLGSHRGTFRYWALADQMLVRNGPGEQDGVIAFAAFVRGDPAISAFATQVTAGLLDRAFWGARPQDQIGALVTYQKLSSALGKEEALEQEFALPLPNGATGGQTSEIVFELNYNIQVCNGLTFQPDLQYVVRPNAQADIKNATVLGFRAHVTF
jgi:porin